MLGALSRGSSLLEVYGVAPSAAIFANRNSVLGHGFQFEGYMDELSKQLTLTPYINEGVSPDALSTIKNIPFVIDNQQHMMRDVLNSLLVRHQGHALDFQEDVVKKARKILARYDGVMVADSVGLGKTWIGKKLLEDYA